MLMDQATNAFNTNASTIEELSERTRAGSSKLMSIESVIQIGGEAHQPSGVPANAALPRRAIDARWRSIARAAIEADAPVGQLKVNKAFIGQATRDSAGRFLYALLQHA